MRVLITGAAGFIGSHLAERLVARGNDVTGFDNFDAFYARSLKTRNLSRLQEDARFTFVEGDLCRPEDVSWAFSQAPVDVVVHLAALAGVAPSLVEPRRYFEVNVTGTLNVFEAARAAGVRHVVFASSSSVYGADSVVPFKESDPCARPVSPYAATKRAGELLAFTEHHVHGVGVTALRFFTVYGARQRPDLAIRKFTRLIAEGKRLTLYGDGSTSRDYTWIDDIIDGVVAAIDQQRGDAASQYRVYNLGGSQTTTLRELVDAIAAALGKPALVDHQPERMGDMRRTLADVSLAGRDLGYAPRVSIREGIPRFVEWWQREGGG